ncbi:hypothetical protein CJP74_05200 [Psittacicella melopsittaci]|uniref:Ribosome-associated protein n=1 Tax=Psittacicella melopsittaci TaxID=2028576 RepID=A0A3A1Y3M4_9GAMM|nr:DUF615 domain-containing protein [Psittacicella melopsittaci]RIY32165.1 hypothetical protein CJP74_05200 [Psittacicella melopsittaci]
MARFKKDFDWDQIARDNQADEEIIYVSKSEIKRDAKDYRKIAAQLVELNITKIIPLGFDNATLDAIKQAKVMKNMEAKRRQINFVAKQLRKYDLEELSLLLKETDPTGQVAAGSDVQLDKQIRVTIDRLQQPQFQERALDSLERQDPSFDRAKVLELLAQTKAGEDPLNTELWNYFFALFRNRISK